MTRYFYSYSSLYFIMFLLCLFLIFFHSDFFYIQSVSISDLSGYEFFLMKNVYGYGKSCIQSGSNLLWTLCAFKHGRLLEHSLYLLSLSERNPLLRTSKLDTHEVAQGPGSFASVRVSYYTYSNLSIHFLGSSYSECPFRKRCMHSTVLYALYATMHME